MIIYNDYMCGSKTTVENNKPVKITPMKKRGSKAVVKGANAPNEEHPTSFPPTITEVSESDSFVEKQREIELTDVTLPEMAVIERSRSGSVLIYAEGGESASAAALSGVNPLHNTSPSKRDFISIKAVELTSLQ